MPSRRFRDRVSHWGPARVFVLLMLLTLLPAAPARAQLSGVDLDVQRDFLGLGGAIRPGAWAPMRLTLRSHAAEARSVICRWLLTDEDGDRVIARRVVTLSPNRVQRAWLYAVPEVNTNASVLWQVQVLGEASGELLASVQVRPDRDRFLDQRTGAIGIVGNTTLGLKPFTNTDTRHEQTRLLPGLKLGTLPDRWYGLSLLHALIWTPANGDRPDDAVVSPAIKAALRGWVRRGGHLVIVLPTVGRPWSGSSLADMLPVAGSDMRRVEGYPPVSVGAPQSAERARVQMTVFNVDDAAPGSAAGSAAGETSGGGTSGGTSGGGVSVIDRTREGEPVVVARRYGLGRVTLIGVPLASDAMRQMGLPTGKLDTIWHKVFGWQAPVFTKTYVDGEIQNNRMSRPDSRGVIELGRFIIPGRIAMRNTAGPALLAAVLVFGLYWLLAGPVMFAVLKRRDALRHSWLAFLAVVLAFTAIAWGGAALMRPRAASISHFSVVTGDGNTHEVHAESWMSVFVPRFGDVPLALDPDHPEARDTLASPGLLPSPTQSGFLDPQTYAFDAADPDAYAAPFRATAKQFHADFLGTINAPAPGLSTPWVLPNGPVRLDDTFWPTGKLTHQLPGPLTAVVFVYCPGDGQTPFVWRRKDPWNPGQTIEIKRQPAAPLVTRPRSGRYEAKRTWVAEGFLGSLIGMQTGQQLADLDPTEVSAADNEIIQGIEMLSFFDALPPPNFRDTDYTSRRTTYQRRLARDIDLTPLTEGRRLIILGHLEDSPLPLPLTVDGETPPAHGWTVVRTILEIP